MRKKIISLVLAMTLVFAYAVPVAATESDSVVPEVPAVENIIDSVDPDAVTDEAIVPNGADSTGTVSEDPDVQAAYDAYVNMVEAYNVNEYGPMADYCEQLDEITFDFTDAQAEEWNRVIEEIVGYEEFLENAFCVAYVMYAVECQQAYKAEPNVKTATEFVAAYDMCVEEGITIELMDPDIAADYEAAKADQPSESVLNVYYAYDELAFELEFAWWGEDFIAACEDFEAVLDDFNALTEAELEELAELMGAENGEEAWNIVFADWINANLVLEIGAAYDAFLDNKNADTAKAYVDAYDSVKNDTELLTQADKDVILAFFADGSYEMAQGYLADESAADTTDEPSDKSDEGTPATGDDFNAVPYAALMLVAAAVAAAALKRKRVQ